jgi:hypothetical protein
VLASGVLLLAKLGIGFGEELVSLDGSRLNSRSFFEVGEGASGVALQRQDASAEEVRAVMVGIELKRNIQVIQGFWDPIDSGIHRR